LRKKEEGGLEEYRMDPYASSLVSAVGGAFFRVSSSSKARGNEGKRRRKKGGVS
jgi:hypothetical protein